MSYDPKNYLPPNHDPHARGVGEIYAQAHRELALPAPSVRLKAFSKFAYITGGFRPYEFTILCGSTGTGKTTLAANWSSAMIEQGVSHFVASVETGPSDFVKRVISCMAREDWNTGDPIAVEKLKRFHEEHGSKFISDTLQLSLYDNRFSVATLIADLAWMVKRKSTKVAIIDNLNFFLEVTSAQAQVIEMDRVIHELIIFCKRTPIHLIMVMHPKKGDGSKGNRVESEFDVKGSSTAVQEAHNVFLFNRAHPELIKTNMATEKDRELMIAKMRRKGKFVGTRLVLKSTDGVSYSEGEVL
jgi:archaellum biogenesis ATPase FlaH